VTVPAIGAIGGVLPPSALTETGSATGVSGTGTGTAGTSIEGGVQGSAGVESTTGVEGASGGESGGFGAALTQAISSLEQTQTSAAGAAQALATGTASNPESAVVTVENAQLAMQLASQIRTKAVEAAQQIFQTQM
jgi:flagellar hook-basal body complex protein FliE